MNESVDKILIADDSELSYKVIAEILKTTGSRVELFYAEDGRKACEMAIEIIPDLILMDIIMPEMNGIEAIRHLRADKRTVEIPIIVLSATESLDSVYDVGANDFISKPFKQNELLIKVRSALDLLKKIKQIRQQNLELERKHVEVLVQRDKVVHHQKGIIADINYAKRIQRAILPTEKDLMQAFPQHFVLDLPCSIVSGDFYWIGTQPGKKIIAVADCTGHGVSGAFMTMAGTAFLNQILSQNTDLHTSDILMQLRELVMKLLKQKGAEGETNVGMDIAIAMLDEDKKELEFSGANNPLYMVHKGELMIYKGDRMPIGIHLNFNQPFIQQEVKLESGDMVYMFTDGYADQFGGPRNKKFRYRQFQELLLSVHQLPLNEQKEKLSQTMTDWRGKNDQVDDILIVGFRI